MTSKWLLLVCIFGLALPVAAVGAEPPAKIEIDYSDEMISADVENAPLEDVLDIITEQTGLEFLLADDLSEVKISAAFKDLEIDKGLKKILNRTNHAFVYGPNRTIIKVAVFGKIKKEFPDMVVPEEPAQPIKAETEPPGGAEMKSFPPGDAEMVTLEPTNDPMVVLPPSGEPMVTNPPSGEPMVIMDADGNYREVPDSGS